MKSYIFEVVIEEGNDEFWEELIKKNINGVVEVRQIILHALDEFGLINRKVVLKEYKYKAERGKGGER